MTAQEIQDRLTQDGTRAIASVSAYLIGSKRHRGAERTIVVRPEV